MTMTEETPVTKRDLIEQKIEKVFPSPSGVRVAESGALAYANMSEVIEAAKMMSMSGAMIPPWLQGNPGACWAILIQASHWGFEPVAVARMAYEVTDKEGRKQVSYMSQLLHALIEARAPLKRRLRFEYAGEGETRACTCTGHIRGEVDPLEYTSPPLAKITPKRSPLWSSDPDQQLAYYSSRAWARRYCPDVLLGVYDGEEIERGPKDVTPAVAAADALHNRLAAANADGGTGEGFHPAVVEDGLGNRPAEARDAISEPEAIEVAPEAKNDASATPQRKPKAAQKRPRQPRTPDQYREWVAGWLQDYKTEQAVEERWRGEMKLRNAAQVTSEDKAQIRLLVDQRIAELRK